ncbi:hypothetical protein DL96DRAFT_1811920 [Flagelloscypha sp. PMI_526]|nr:hypothetical protein DL96DRAFT_1811920 [Flagelloscypha sp. PMI_526]
MSSTTPPSSSPDLPPELEFKIFEMCYFTNPPLLPTLLLVCKRVFERLNEICYYSMQLHQEDDVARVERWIQTQRPQSIQQNVKALLVNVPHTSLYTRIMLVASRCTGVEFLGFWLHPDDGLQNGHNTVSLESMLRVMLMDLPNVRHLSLITDKHLFRTDALGSHLAKDIAFRDRLVFINWGFQPGFRFSTFPNVSYAMIQPRWPLRDEDLKRMEEWISQPGSKGLILLVEEEELQRDEYASTTLQHVGKEHILRNEKVVLLNAPHMWAQDWDSFVFGDGENVFNLGKRLVGLQRLEDRVVAVGPTKPRAFNFPQFIQNY